MNEIKNSKKPVYYFYIAMAICIILFNFMVMPWLLQRQIQEIDYGTFITMTENQEVDEVQIQSNQILFTAKDSDQIYKTGIMEDPELVDRLQTSGAKFSSEIVEETSPFLSFLLTWIFPTLIFIGIGQLMSKRMVDHAGGPGSMMFNTGRNNAKVYVKSSSGITFGDVQGEEEAKENLMEIVDYLDNPDKYKEIGASMPKGVLLV
jgi:cell division protease FtsH